MKISRRIKTCRLIEQMQKQTNYCISLGIKDCSKFKTEPIAYTSSKSDRSK